MRNNHLAFIDLFSGCGGLSLGLLKSGWKGLFAIEKNPDAFKTLKRNLVYQNKHKRILGQYDWPNWLEVGPIDISLFLEHYKKNLYNLRGKVQLIAGGPPCQGFSFAGKRALCDPRNELFQEYLKIVEIIRPKLVLMENVPGINVTLGKSRKCKRLGEHFIHKESHATRFARALENLDYDVQQHVIKSEDFGIPQARNRFFTLGIRRDLLVPFNRFNLVEFLYDQRQEFLRRRGLPVDQSVTVMDAISDLTVMGKRLENCVDVESPSGFLEITYEGPQTSYQRLMNLGFGGEKPNSLRLAKHKAETIKRFELILDRCPKGKQIPRDIRVEIGIKKKILVPLSPNKPANTITTLPDDLLHYSEPRIHSVREHARIQSFPDCFAFYGKFTTGGKRRSHECPRYTQVGNAVPPLLAEIIGEVLKRFLEETSTLKTNEALKRIFIKGRDLIESKQ